ncbi:hypothetical protein ANN_24561 [Periplaneta americana]|uniref:HTH psq-type domain-containing protein n=1 Tax=Periplaneta americana TaxID=6978 RepID=A0ABQ8S3C4_PERAM|nr:hypothetical protein ANN_24561 [Periplaneta americana]
MFVYKALAEIRGLPLVHVYDTPSGAERMVLTSVRCQIWTQKERDLCRFPSRVAAAPFSSRPPYSIKPAHFGGSRLRCVSLESTGRLHHVAHSRRKWMRDDLRKSEVLLYQSIWHVPCRPSFVYLASTAAYKTKEPRSVHSNTATQRVQLCYPAQRSAGDTPFSIESFLCHCYPPFDFLAAAFVTAYSTPSIMVKCKRKTSNSWTQNDVQKAIKAFREGRSQRYAAELLGVPHSCLQRRLQSG